ncbi:MAG: Flp pilus assembly protein CpaB [Desulfobaccales bacterium]
MRQLPGWIWLLVAFICASLATYVFFVLVKREPAVPVVKEKTSLVVVATTQVDPASSLNAAQLKTEVWHQENPPQGSFGNIQELLGRVTATSLSPGELVTENKLTPRGTIPGLSALLSPDQRAMTVKVDEVSGVAGFPVIGDRVDVMVTVDKGEYDKDPISKILFQNLKVLGADQRMESRPGDKPLIVRTVTLEVSPEEGERLALAAQEQHISLVLRGRGDQKLVRTTGVDTATLLGLPSKANKTVPPVALPRRTVDVIRGLQRSPVEF